jgi:blue copper oxidase
MGINGPPMDMVSINERVRLGQWERWLVKNDDGDHPFHVYGCSFLILSQDDGSVSDEEAGWKDNVWVNDSAESIVRFEHSALEKQPYMYQCPILVHEDMGWRMA